MIEATIEEFEQGTWVADLVAFEAFSGSFSLAGDTWTGKAVSERVDFSRYHTRVVGGANGLAKVLQDKYYTGSVSLAVAVQDVCRESGETFGTATPGLFLTNFERIRGSAASALDSLAKAFSLIWWIDRSGKVNMQAARNTGAEATGTRVSSDVDASILLVEPSGVQVGVGYSVADTVAKMAAIRHVRWRYTADRFSAQLYDIPFIFRPPVQNEYDALRDARVDKDNGDGTIDVIVSGRFGVTRVPLLCGVPASKVLMHGGEQVTLGFYGGDPQKPYCLAMAQDTTATKKVGRVGDSVTVTLGAATGNGLLSALAALLVCAAPGSPCTALPVSTLDIPGTITGGSNRLKVGD